MNPEDQTDVDELTFAEEVNRPEPGLVRAALLFAREIAYPDLRPSRYLMRLDEWAEAATFHMRRDKPLERGQALARFLFSDLGVEGNDEEYYDPRNSYLNEVMDRRLGIPIALSALFLHLAERTGLEAEGIGLPGHFIVAVRDDNIAHYFDPFEGGAQVAEEDLREMIERRTGYRGAFNPEWLQPVGIPAMLARMLYNLRGVYLGQNEWPKAVLAVERLTLLQPHVAAHRRDLGFILARAGRPLAAAEQLSRYLLLEPDADDAAMVRESMNALAARGGRLN